jgi:hypothetical protein
MALITWSARILLMSEWLVEPGLSQWKITDTLILSECLSIHISNYIYAYL